MYNIHVKIIKGVIQYMNKFKLLKEYMYMDILDVEFNILIYFDYDNEVLLYSLKYIDNNYDTSDYLDEYATCFDEEKIYNIIKSFMLEYVASQSNCYIEENEYSEWKVVVIKDGLKLINDKTQQFVEWNIHDYDEDYEVIQNKIKKFLDLNNQH